MNKRQRKDSVLVERVVIQREREEKHGAVFAYLDVR